MAPEIGIGLVGYGAIGRLHALCYRMLPLVYPDLPIAARLIAVAMVGFMMLTGRMNWRFGATVIIGCFILFGAGTIVAGIQSAAAG